MIIYCLNIIQNQVHQRAMAYSSLIQVFDRLSVKSILKGSTASILGVIATVLLIFFVLLIYIPPAISYFKGSYYQSEYTFTGSYEDNLYSDVDFKFALVFKNRRTGQIYNHSKISQFAITYATYLNTDTYLYYTENALSCSPDYFKGCLNAPILQSEGCFIVPHNVLFNAAADSGLFGLLSAYKSSQNPFDQTYGQSTADPNLIQLKQFLQDNYYEAYFTSKILTDSGKTALYVNSIYSTEYTPNNALYSIIDVAYYKRTTFLDDSVMPWANNKSISGLIWNGLVFGQALESSYLVYYAPQIVMTPINVQIYAYRFYKKLDWLLGIIGGGMFLLFLIFWVPFSYINRTLNKIQIAERIYIKEGEGEGEGQENKMKLEKITVSKMFILTNLLPFNSKEDEIIAASQKELDIVKLTKKMKVAIRNLEKQKLFTNFKPKALQYDEKTLQQEKQIQQITDEVHQISDQTKITIIQNKKQTSKYYQNNPTMLSILQEKQKLKQVMFDQQYDKEQGHYIEKKKTCCNKFANFLSKISWFDCFGAKPMLISEPHNATLCGISLTILIITLSVLTFALTIANMNKVQHIIDVDFLQDADVSYTMTTGKSFKMAICFGSPQKLIPGPSQMASLKFYSYTTEGKKYLSPVRLSNGDFKYFGYTDSTQTPVPLDYCFKPQDNHQIDMRSPVAPHGQAYFGFQISPADCLSSASACASIYNTTIANFVKYVNSAIIYLFLPENNFDPSRQILFSQLNRVMQFFNSFYFNSTLYLKETLYRGSAKIIDDTKTDFMRVDLPTIGVSITDDGRSEFPFSRSYINSVPGYQFEIKPHNQQTSYILRRYKIDFLFGVFGGVFFFWYCLIYWFGKLYNAFNVRASMSKVLYDEQNQQDCVLNKALYVCGTPLCCIPSCCSMKDDIKTLKIVDRRILNELDCLSLVKYVDNCYRLSSSFYSSIQAKNLSLVFFRQKVDFSQNVKPKVEEQPQQIQDDEFLQFEDIEEIDQQEEKHGKGQIVNSSETKLNATTMRLDEKMAGELLIDMKKEKINDNLMPNTHKKEKLKLFDIFQSSAQLTFKGKRQVGSVCGGLLFLLLLLLTLIVAQHQIGLYLTRKDKTVSWSTGIESDAGMKQGISLSVGENFKFGMVFTAFYQSFAHNISAQLNHLGISLIKVNLKKSNGTIIQNEQFIDLIPCPSNYFNGFKSSLIDSIYISDINLGYCIPDGQKLQINGLPADDFKNYFKVSVYNKIGNATMNTTLLNGTTVNYNGDKLLRNFFTKYNVVYYFSTPRANSHSRSIEYELHSLVFDINSTYPVEHNVSLSKQQMTFDDGIGWDSDPATLSMYSYDQFSAETNDYYGSYTSSPWYNLTFSSNGKIEYYYLTAPKFCQSFGVLGGIIVFFIFGFGFLARSFNNYRLLYLIGRELYVFDKLRFKEVLNQRKRQRKKNKEERQSISKVNNYSQIDIFLAYCLSFIGGLLNNYNFNQTLRRITLIQQKVEQDLNLAEFYKRLHQCRDILNENVTISQANHIKLTDVFPKHIYNPNPVSYTHPTLANYAKKHNLSSYDQMKVFNAQQKHINIKEVFDDKYLLKIFDIEDENSSVHMSQMRQTVGSMVSSAEQASVQ